MPNVWRLTLSVVLVIVALAAIGEVFLHTIAPDTVAVTAHVPNGDSQHPPTRIMNFSTVIHDPRRAADVRDAIDSVLPTVGVMSCPDIGRYPSSYTFTLFWHGLNVETASVITTDCAVWNISQGGLSETRALAPQRVWQRLADDTGIPLPTTPAVTG